MTGVLTGNVRSINVIDATVDLGSVAANTSEEETATVPGVKVGDMVFVSKPSIEAGLIIGSARVTADDTVAIQVGNFTGGAIDEASETLRFLIVRPEGLSGAARVSD